ncbi:hypothetical protein ACLB1R_31890 [Escherichia coli]
MPGKSWAWAAFAEALPEHSASVPSNPGRALLSVREGDQRVV